MEFAKSLNAADLYELDQYWLLLYVLFQDGKITNPYACEDAFEILKDNGVVFVANTTDTMNRSLKMSSKKISRVDGENFRYASKNSKMVFKDCKCLSQSCF